MRAFSVLSILIEDFGVTPGAPQPCVGIIVMCEMCGNQVDSVVALDAKKTESPSQANKLSGARICRSCLNMALHRLDELAEEDESFKRQDEAIFALEKAKEENA